jgi:hypothetical protein
MGVSSFPEGFKNFFILICAFLGGLYDSTALHVKEILRCLNGLEPMGNHDNGQLTELFGSD